MHPGSSPSSLGFALLVSLAASSPLVAQITDVIPGQPTQQLQQALLQNPALADQIRSKIQTSGLTPEQVRARLSASGYPPNLLDAYLVPGGPAPTTQPGSQELLAIQALGLGSAPSPAMPVDTGAMKMRGQQLSDADLASGRYVFGVDMFQRRTTQFLPVLAGPAPPDYRLGPGDQLVLILTGDVELAYPLAVTREGFIVIPQVGQIFVSSLTLDQLRSILYTRLGRVYSSVKPGSDARTHMELSVANVRVNQVYVVGEVGQSGAYQISALGTVLTALYASGGVTTRSNMRQIEIRRAEKVVATLDMYDYLIRGDKSNDIRLETGDVIYVPLHGRRVQITGAVLRPAIYELAPGETLVDLTRAAGSFRADAALDRLAIYRIVPLPERGSGPFPRAVVTVPLSPVLAADHSSPPPAPGAGEQVGAALVPRLGLEDGDSIVVDVVPPLERSYFVTIVGAVIKPGRYPWRDGMTLRDLVMQARGPLVSAYLHDAEIARLPRDRSQGQFAETMRVPLDSTYLVGRDSGGRYLGPPGPPIPASGTPEVPLAPYDNVLILRQPEFGLVPTVFVGGQVRFPGTYGLASGKDRLADLMDRVGGLTSLAYPGGIRFVRVADGVGRVDVDLERAMKERTSRSNVVLQAGDSIIIPQYQPSVKVLGAVNAPGSVLWVKGESLNYYLDAAGGPNYKADAGRTSVLFANGEVRTRHRSLIFFSNDPEPGPGSEIVVPPRDPTKKGIDPVILIGVIAQLVSATVALVAVAQQ